MKLSAFARLLLGAFLIFSAWPAAADDSSEARAWVEKLLSIYDQESFQVAYEARLEMSSLGQPMSGTLTGRLAQADRGRSRMQLSFEMPPPPENPDGGMELSLLTVKDGTTVWTEMHNPAFGGKQVTRVSLAEVEKLRRSAAGAGMDPASIDPFAQLENLTGKLEFEVLERSGGKVTLRGVIPEEARAELGMLALPGIDGFIFVLDEKTGFPDQIRADGDPPFITMDFRDLKLGAKLPAELFEYTPPEGLPVTDLGAMLRSQ